MSPGNRRTATAEADIRLFPVAAAPLAPSRMAGRVRRVTGAGSLLRIDVSAGGVDWVILAVQRETRALGLDLAADAPVALELPTEAIHLIP